MPRLPRLKSRGVCAAHGKLCARREPTRWCSEPNSEELDEQLRTGIFAALEQAREEGIFGEPDEDAQPVKPTRKTRRTIAQIDAEYDAIMAEIAAMNEDHRAERKAGARV